ncbi:hypothetical protein GCM10027290_53940 [Micromonospora sonneratiae]|uniref:DUF4913 domain-containing protein n=1 Tax=Micromonospora sonneratiae TaxID=1184706 RepID=A0ABW3YDM8_9ACTN
MSDNSPLWDWRPLPPQRIAQNWEAFGKWVEWLQESYAAWVILPACWPAHEALVLELKLFWYWYRRDVERSRQPNPVDGINWHESLRRSANAWRELASCTHEPPVRHHQQIQADRRARTRRFIAEAIGSTGPVSQEGEK